MHLNLDIAARAFLATQVLITFAGVLNRDDCIRCAMYMLANPGRPVN
jgi:hypothetical protein